MAYLRKGTAFYPSTVTAGTLGSGVTFPAGHVVKTSVYPVKDTASIYCSSSSYIDTGFEVLHTTRLSSTNSYFKLEFCSAMFKKEIGASAAQIDFTMRTAAGYGGAGTPSQQTGSGYPDAGTPAWAVGDSCIEGGPNNYNFYMHGQYGTQTITKYGQAYIGLVSGMSMPTNKASWSAGEDLYFRMFGKVASGTFRVTHEDSIFSLSITEIKR